MTVGSGVDRCDGGLPDAAFAVALLNLPAMWAQHFGALLGQRQAGDAAGQQLFRPTGPRGPARSAREVWDLVRRGRAVRLLADGRRPVADAYVLAQRWAKASEAIDVSELWAPYMGSGVAVDLLGEDGYPVELAGDPKAPFALFRSGRVTSLAGRRAAIVGTRRATDVGRDIARELGEGLAASGVRIVSGLALGIDAAAHEGALAAGAAPPIGVVAGGFDNPYPARNRVLWGQVEARGALVSEAPLGTRSMGWRFPARNRIIAALAEVVIVVESAATGGSMLTASTAAQRGRTVMAVPGSPRNPVAAGTNDLLRDGAPPVTSVADVLDELWLPEADRLAPPSPEVEARHRPVLEAVDWEPTPTDRIIARTGLAPPVVVGVLAQLDMQGLVAAGPGTWRRIGLVRPRRSPEP